jgi:hypothetical protein
MHAARGFGANMVKNGEAIYRHGSSPMDCSQRVCSKDVVDVAAAAAVLVPL